MTPTEKLYQRDRRVLVKQHWPKKFKQGFTLVELMIIFAMISVLLAVAISAFNNVKASSQEHAAKAALDKIEIITEWTGKPTVTESEEDVTLECDPGFVLEGFVNSEGIVRFQCSEDNGHKIQINKITEEEKNHV